MKNILKIKEKCFERKEMKCSNKKKKAVRWYVSNVSHFFKSEPKLVVYNNLK